MNPKTPSAEDMSGRHFLMLGLAGMVLAVFWNLFGADFQKALYHLRLCEMNILGIFNEDYSSLKNNLLANAHYTRDDLSSLMGAVVGETLRMPVGAFLFILAFWAYRGSLSAQYCHRYTLESLLGRLGRFWPACVPLAHPSGKSQEKPLEKDALTAWEWAEARGLNPESSLASIREALVCDLGNIWRGREALKDYEKALLVLFGASPSWTFQERHTFKCDLAACRNPRGGFKASYSVRKRMRESFKDETFLKQLQKLSCRHAYEGTVLMACLVEFRAQKGLLPSCDFLWLKQVDRPLWYALNNLGRRTFHVEALALMSQYQEEGRLGKKSAFPLLAPAASALFKHVQVQKGRVS